MIKTTLWRLIMEMPSYRSRNSRYKDKKASWPSYLYTGNRILVKTVFILWQILFDLFFNDLVN